MKHTYTHSIDYRWKNTDRKTIYDKETTCFIYFSPKLERRKI